MALRSAVGAAAFAALTMVASANAQPAAQQNAQPLMTPVAPAWSFSPDMAYAYGADGRTTAYKLGTSNAKFLFQGAKKVPRNTIFFVGENGQLYMRTGPYLENGKFSFGPG